MIETEALGVTKADALQNFSSGLPEEDALRLAFCMSTLL